MLQFQRMRVVSDLIILKECSHWPGTAIVSSCKAEGLNGCWRPELQMHVSEGDLGAQHMYSLGRLLCENVDAQDLANVRRGMRVSIER